MKRKSSPLLLLDVLAFRVELVHIPAVNWQHCIANGAFASPVGPRGFAH
jgi:hypothetical protein